MRVCIAGVLIATGVAYSVHAADGDAGIEHHDIVVLGAGPGGVQVARSLSRAGADFVVVERASGPGSYFKRFPRHRTLISINKRHTGHSDPEYRMRHDWNSLVADPESRRFTNYTEALWPDADLIPEYLENFIAEHSLANVFRWSTEVTEVRKENNRFELRTGRPIPAAPFLTCNVLIVATGRFKPHVNRTIGGWEHMVGYEELDTSPEGLRKFDGKRVLIVGGGNSAMETADSLEAHAAYVHIIVRSQPRLAHQTHYVGDLRAVNLRTLDRYLLKSEEVLLKPFYDGNAEFSLHKQEDGTIKVTVPIMEDDQQRHPYDYAIRCIGFRPDLSIFHPSALPELLPSGAFPRLTSAYESANVSNLFFTGNLAHGRDYRRSSGGFIHGFRYVSSVLPDVIALRREKKAWPVATRLPCDAAALCDRIHSRMRTASSMYQMFGYMGDVAVLPMEGGGGECGIDWHDDVPLELLTSGVLTWGAPEMLYITLSMEWHPKYFGRGALWGKSEPDEWERDYTFPGENAEEREHLQLTQDRGADRDYAKLFGTTPSYRGQPRSWTPPTRPSECRGGKCEEWRGASLFLHPIIRVWRRKPKAEASWFGGKAKKAPWGGNIGGQQDPELVASHHVPEDIYTTFDDAGTMAAPLRKFVEDKVVPLLQGGAPPTSNSQSCTDAAASCSNI